MSQKFYNGLQNLLSGLEVIFSITGLIAINVVTAGQLLGYVFHLKKRGNHVFAIKIPPTKNPILSMGITGDQVTAGFAAFTVSLFVTAVWLHEFAGDIVINRLQATPSQWVACLFTSTCLSLIVCLALSMVRMTIVAIQTQIAIRSKPNLPSEEELKKKIMSPHKKKSRKK